MSKSSNQKMKILYLLEILIKRTDPEHPIATNEIILLLNQRDITCERKSIYDDIRVLQEYGYDILHKKERPSGYYLNSRDFELAELKLLVDAVQASRFITAKKSQELIKKVEALASIHDGKQLHRQVFVDNRVKAENETIYYNVDFIHNAIQDNRKIRFQYFEWNVKKEPVPRKDGAYYEISPWAVDWKDENYYMIGYDHSMKMIKHYRVDKMLKISTTKKQREGKEHFQEFDTAKYVRGTFGMFHGEEVTVKLEGESKLVGALIDRFGTDIMIRPQGRDKFCAHIKIQESQQFYGWLVGLGSGIIIKGPKEVRKGFEQHIKKVCSLYQSTECEDVNK